MGFPLLSKITTRGTPSCLGIPKQEGVPRVVIFDKEGKALNLDTHDRWRTARDSKQQEIFNYFQKYVLIPH